jgi:hypothetical protein
MREDNERFKVFWCTRDKAYRNIFGCKERQKMKIDTCSPECEQAVSMCMSINAPERTGLLRRKL